MAGFVRRQHPAATAWGPSRPTVMCAVLATFAVAATFSLSRSHRRLHRDAWKLSQTLRRTSFFDGSPANGNQTGTGPLPAPDRGPSHRTHERPTRQIWSSSLDCRFSTRAVRPTPYRVDDQ